MSLLGQTTPMQILRGKIRSLNSISVDRSLSIDGASADAKAAGDGIAEAKRIANEHIENNSNPHGVTKAQLGLNNVDNTSDMDKPVSTLQAAAIAEAKKAGTDAQTAGGNAHTAADNAQAAADKAQVAADEAKAAADEAKISADNAQATADSKTAWFTADIALLAAGWSGSDEFWQSLDIEGVTSDRRQPVFVVPFSDSEEDYWRYGIKVDRQGSGYITFTCKKKPLCDISLQVVGFTMPVTKEA